MSVSVDLFSLGTGKIWGQTLVKGPIEAARIKLQLFEQLIGIRGQRRRQVPRRGGRLGPAGTWLLRELKAGRMTRAQQDLLGEALAFEMEGLMAEAQAKLDELEGTFAPERLGELAASAGQVQNGPEMR